MIIKLTRRLFFTIFVLFLLVLIGSTAIAYKALDTEPSVELNQTIRSENIKRATHAIKRVTRSLKQEKDNAWVHFSAAETNDILLLLNKKEPRIKAVNTMRNGESVFEASINLPELSFFANKRYLNIRSRLIDSPKIDGPTKDNPKGLIWEDTYIGSIQVPNWLVNKTQQTLAHSLLGESMGQAFLDSISHVKVSDHNIVLRYSPVASYEELITEAAQRFKALSGFELPVQDERIHYYSQVIDISVDQIVETQNANSMNLNPSNLNPINLSQTLSQLLHHAHVKSTENDLPLAQENSAALIALTNYFVPGYLKRFIDGHASLPNNKHNIQLTLAERPDLAKHFLLSASLKLISNEGTSYGLGELKEIFDSRTGGSGFSFIDLAADRAGILFTQVATQDEQRAKALAIYFEKNNVSDNDLFIDKTSLKEGLSELEFIKTFENTNSEQYNQVINAIDKQILSNVIFQL